MAAWARVAVLLFAVGWGANHFVPLLLVYRERLQLSPIDLAILFGAYALGLVPGLLLGGPLPDRRGRRPVVLSSSSLALVGTLLLAAAARFSMLLAGRLVVGAGCGAAFSAGTAWVQDLAHDAPEGVGARRAAVALSAGFGGGPLISSIVAQWLPGPMVTPYIVHAALLVVALVLAWPAADRHRRQPFGEKAGWTLPRGFFLDVAPVAPWVFALPSISFAVLPALVRRQLGHLTVAYAGVVAATTLLAGVLAQPVVRAATPRRAATWGMLLGTLGLAAGFVATARASPAGVFVAAAFLGAGYGACLVAGLRWIAASTSAQERGRVVGIFYVLTYVGFTSPLLLAAIARRAGDGVGLVMATALALVTTVYTASRRWVTDSA